MKIQDILSVLSTWKPIRGELKEVRVSYLGYNWCVTVTVGVYMIQVTLKDEDGNVEWLHDYLNTKLLTIKDSKSFLNSKV